MSNCRSLVLLLVLLTTACGVGGSRGAPTECFEIGGTSLGLGKPGDGILITVEVRFLEFEEDFLALQGYAEGELLLPQPDAFPTFGGGFSDTREFGIDGDYVGGVGGTTAIKTAGHHAGSFLPQLPGGPSPGLNGIGAFVQAPGLDAQCLRVADPVIQPLPGLTVNAAPIPLVPSGDADGNGFTYDLLTPGQRDALLALVPVVSDAVTPLGPRGQLVAPRMTLFNGQRAFVTAFQFEASVTDLNANAAAALQNFLPNVAQILSGMTLEFVPRVLPGTPGEIEIEIRPTSHGLVAVGPADPEAPGGTTNVLVPVLQNVSVQSTVSVPDGGTVLLGGITKVREGRNPTGVPVLNRIPYVNRLFTNVGVGRSADSLALMITPRIVIQDD